MAWHGSGSCKRDGKVQTFVEDCLAGTLKAKASRLVELLDRSTHCSLVLPVCLSQSAGPNPKSNKSKLTLCNVWNTLGSGWSERPSNTGLKAQAAAGIRLGIGPLEILFATHIPS